MEFECLLYEKAEKIATVRLNRPRVLNAMNRQLWKDLELALDNAGSDPDITVLIITGEGRAFSTGADLKESGTRTPEAYREYLENLQDVSKKIIRYEKPVIAAINGYALGSGYELALACDIRIAADDAQIGSPEARVTSSVTGGAMRLVQELIGPGKARELLFSAKNISGVEAARIGLVNCSVPADQLMETARRMAEEIAQNSSFSLRMIKKGLLMAREVSLDALMEYETEACLACVTTKEREASLSTFAARKKSPDQR